MGKNKSNPLSDWQEWQEKQFLPGEYIGRPWPFNIYRSKKVGWLFILIEFGLPILAGILLIKYETGDSRIVGLIFIAIIIFLFGASLFFKKK